MKVLSLLIAFVLVSAIIIIGCASVVLGRTTQDIDVTLVDPSSATSFNHFWKESFGSGHALLATRRDWLNELRRVRDDIGMKRARFHGIFDDDVSVVLAKGKYEFYTVDQVYDGMLSLGVRPIVELSFMPAVLANCGPWISDTAPRCQTVMHYLGIVQPPTNFSDWTDLVAAFATHLVDRYGIEEVATWRFEVWNELWGIPYDDGTYSKLFDASYRGLKSVSPRLAIGGPATMQLQYLGEFARDHNASYDFISSHLYPTDPNCSAGGAYFGRLDCFADTIRSAATKVPAGVPFLLTEYNAGLSNPWLLYSSYAAAFVFRNVPLLHGVLDTWSYWTFSDIFEENGMHGPPFSGFNYGIAAQGGIKKPVYRAFELLRDAGDKLLPVTSSLSFSNSTANAFATFDDQRNLVSIFLSNFAPYPLDAPGFVDVVVRLLNQGTSSSSSSSQCSSVFALNVTSRTIDNTSANAYAEWTKTGSPQYPSQQQVEAINAASAPVITTVQLDATDCSVKLTLTPFSVVRLDVDVVIQKQQQSRSSDEKKGMNNRPHSSLFKGLN